MKNYFYNAAVLFLLLCILKTDDCKGQWQPDTRLTNNPANSCTPINNSWCIASGSGAVHIVWYDDRDGNYEIYYKRSTNDGASWDSDVRLTNSPGTSWYPAIILSGQLIHVVWYDYRDGNSEIYYKRSTNGGLNWSEDKRLTNNPAVSSLPSIAVSGSNVLVVWFDDRDSLGMNREIYIKRSTDYGQTWGLDTRLTNAMWDSENPSISISGQIVNLAWYDVRNGSTEEIYYKRSTDGGITWGPDVAMTNNSGSSVNPQICAIGSLVHLAWIDHNAYHPEIFYKRSTDGGSTWGPIINLSNYIGSCMNPSFALSGSNVHVVWYYDNNDTVRVYYKRSNDAGVTWGPNVQLSENNAVGPSRPSISVSNSSIHVIWCEQRDGNFEIYYKCNPTGNIVGQNNNVTEVPSSFSLSQNYPNPFNQTTIFNLQCSMKGNVRVTVYDVTGREVSTLVNETLPPGTYEVRFDGAALNSGVYFVRMTAGNFSETRRMVLLK